MRNKLIKLLGGYTKEEFDNKEAVDKYPIKSNVLNYKIGDIYYMIKKDDTGFCKDNIRYVKIIELSDIGLRYMPVYIQDDGSFKDGTFIYDPANKETFSRMYKKYDSILKTNT